MGIFGKDPRTLVKYNVTIHTHILNTNSYRDQDVKQYLKDTKYTITLGAILLHIMYIIHCHPEHQQAKYKKKCKICVLKHNSNMVGITSGNKD